MTLRRFRLRPHETGEVRSYYVADHAGEVPAGEPGDLAVVLDEESLAVRLGDGWRQVRLEPKVRAVGPAPK